MEPGAHGVEDEAVSAGEEEEDVPVNQGGLSATRNIMLRYAPLSAAGVATAKGRFTCCKAPSHCLTPMLAMIVCLIYLY
jgi:hypothetical protein